MGAGADGLQSAASDNHLQSSTRHVIAASAEVADKPAWSDVKSTTEAMLVKKLPTAQYNTSSLGLRLLVDGTAAAAAGALVAPIITMIDKGIIENASGKRALGESMRASLSSMLLRPHHFFTSRPFLLIFALYTGTYTSANAIDTAAATAGNKPASSTSAGLAKFSATSAANLSLCLYKDSQFTRLFGAVSTRPVPPVTYALFAARDCMTIFASFNIPPLIAPSVPLSEAAEHYVSRTSVAQFVAPAAVQLLSTPLHLLGLDLYNRNGGTPFRDRMRKVRVDWLKSSFARMARIVPAFGVGGVVNTGVRQRLMKRLE